MRNRRRFGIVGVPVMNLWAVSSRLACARWVAALLVATLLAAATTPARTAQSAPSPGEPPAAADRQVADPGSAQPRARVYLFRGAMGLIFSRGMDALAKKLEHVDITANVYEFTVCDLVASGAIEAYRRDPAPIVLIGHSMGGRCALQFAEKFNEEGIPISLVVTIDPAHLSPDVPPNVERFINIFLSKDVLGGGDIKPARSFHGHYASYDMAEHGEISHITIDKADVIHQQLVAKIVEIASIPAKAEGDSVPLRYVVPPNAEIELWDSGASVAAAPGETLQRLAAQDHLPLWSLTQVNKISESTPLVVGQRVVVPRHLMPLAAISKPVGSRR